MKHKLKILEKFYFQIKSWLKTFEIRRNDRNYQVWDTIEFYIVDKDYNILWEWDIKLKITDVFQEEWYWLNKDICIISFKI